MYITSEDHISVRDMTTMINSNKYKDWFNNITNSEIIVHSIHIVQIDMFGDNFGFGHIIVDAETKDGVKIPGITVIRGDSVFMLTILQEEESSKEWFVMTYQPRIPAGKYLFEIPAGMVDENNGDVAMVAISELVEEIGEELNPKKEELILMDGKDNFSSGGILDENMKLFLFKKILPKSVIDGLRGKRTGLEDEDILVHLVQEENFMKTIQSASGKLAYLMYKMNFNNN